MKDAYVGRNIYSVHNPTIAVFALLCNIFNEIVEKSTIFTIIYPLCIGEYDVYW